MDYFVNDCVWWICVVAWLHIVLFSWILITIICLMTLRPEYPDYHHIGPATIIITRLHHQVFVYIKQLLFTTTVFREAKMNLSQIERKMKCCCSSIIFIYQDENKKSVQQAPLSDTIFVLIRWYNLNKSPSSSLSLYQLNSDHNSELQ